MDPEHGHHQCTTRRMYAVKFRVERDVLAEAVSWVARGLPARPPVPVLSGILLVADAEGVLQERKGEAQQAVGKGKDAVKKVIDRA